MSQTDGMGPVEQKELLDEVARIVLDSAPEGWQLIAVEYKAIGRHVEIGAGAQDAAGEMLAWNPPTELNALFWRLRVGMHEEGLGTWFSAFFRMSPPDTYETYYNRELEVPWSATDADYAQEQEMFPRDEENLPDWLRARIS
ncbi:hypothetical protein [Saccharopolyspora cebuensis]|uniref:DUF600 family protein n=1 Tax=Saccharopolyspora cebuensis TaxID=418759 RepID=A0ABV4CK03_9PSEU